MFWLTGLLLVRRRSVLRHRSGKSVRYITCFQCSRDLTDAEVAALTGTRYAPSKPSAITAGAIRTTASAHGTSNP